MYNLPYHKESDPQLIKKFIVEHPFAFLSGCDTELKPVATQVPLFFEEVNGKQILQGHMMRNTDHHKAFAQNENVLAVFTSPHTYVSATWYSNPSQASTWNYMSVHVKGVMRFVEDNALIDLLRKTTLHFEKGNQNSSTVYDNLPPEYINRVIKAIVAFEIEVTAVDTVFKLSQDRDAESFKNIIEKLNQQDDDAGRFIASEMEKRYDVLYNKI